jgi:hypothetical protein
MEISRPIPYLDFELIESLWMFTTTNQGEDYEEQVSVNQIKRKKDKGNRSGARKRNKDTDNFLYHGRF